MRRREIIKMLGGAAATWALAARAQQPAVPVVGMLNAQSSGSIPPLVEAFRQGLAETGYVEGRNVAIEYRWAENRYDRLQELATDLVRHKVNVIAAPLTATALAAKAATSAIPIVFGVAEDPVELGLVATLARPAGNATGVSSLLREVVTKRLGFLRELVPAAAHVAVLNNPANARLVSSVLNALEPAAGALGMQVQVYKAATVQEIDAAFAELVRAWPDVLFVAPDPFFQTRRDQLAALAVRSALPAVYSGRRYVEAGGLMSYGTSLGLVDTYHKVGVYAGRILSGAKPADLPVQQPTKFELVINLKTAKAIGLTVPDKLLALADEVIE